MVVLSDWMVIAIVVVAYVVLNKWIFPKMGMTT